MKFLISFTLALALSLSPILSSVLALGQKATVTTIRPVDGDGEGLLQLAGTGLDGQILLSAEDWWGVIRAAEDLAVDFGKVTGRNLTLTNWSAMNMNTTNSNSTRAAGGIGKSARSGLQSNETYTNGNGSSTTVCYTYNPVTSFVNYTTGPAATLTGPALSNAPPSHPVIITGTLHKSPLITSLIQSHKLDISSIDGRWESFISEVIADPLPGSGIDRALVVVGSDMRGTVYGLYDVSEQIGVSPWWWWGDVPVRKREGVWALEGRKVQGEPSPALTNWINSNYQPGKYGPGYNHYFYPRVFELLLRLRANYFWPAMWGSMFGVDDTANQPLADAYGIVMGSSHTGAFRISISLFFNCLSYPALIMGRYRTDCKEPMMRATNEWTTFGKEYGGNGQWEYDTNNASLTAFFTYGVQRAKPYVANSLFTMAMRGSGDTAITLTQAQAITVLQDVVAKQREILGDVFNGTKIEEIPQVWCLYKEVQGYYENGLSVPDDVTLLWADDNWGNIRRLPTASETNRSGGAGVYYHFDYVGDPRDYKWINTIQLQKTVEQMQLAYARQADRIWILNVGDLKTLEIPINHFMDLAYDTPAWGYDSVPRWLSLWAEREFGPEHSVAISSVVDRYGMYAARRKYELLASSTYSIVNYNEADAILAQWQELADDAQKVYDGLEDAWKPAYYEMVLQPVLGGQVVNQIYVNAGKNRLYTAQKRNTANKVAEDVLGYFKQDHVLTQRYHDLLDGKWNHMLDRYDLSYHSQNYDGYWQQPMRNTIPALSYVQQLETSLAGSIGIAVEGSNATVPGDDAWHANSGSTLVLPPMSSYGPRTRWIDVFARGTQNCQWTVSISQPYVLATPNLGGTGGFNGTDTRVYISIDWAKAPPAPNTTIVNIGINLTSSCTWGNYPAPTIQVPIHNTAVPSTFTGFVESDSHISIEAEHTTTNTNTTTNTSYTTLPSHGRTLSGVTLADPLASPQPPPTGPFLSYALYSFTPSPSASVTLFLSPCGNINGPDFPMEYGVAFDEEAPQVIQFIHIATSSSGSTSTAAYPLGWYQAVADGIWGSSGNTTTTVHDLSVTGLHTLKVWLLQPGVVLQKIVVDFGGGVRESYLGPPESFRAGVDVVGGYDGGNFAGVDVLDVV
ncbi:hypothetical protein LSUB1_G006062 [Lachnellula subtilissima]|uniref:Gylcosyl hydrolase 115 C-terminal domain-containing protein n=1 Tax=Lachnellula subtilissima TaxID=602034 RepID=A0A8H8RJF8_9HELO|nr:hypothetical protein LSUB1_G006062 [Lachnellula subtilissima]